MYEVVSRRHPFRPRVAVLTAGLLLAATLIAAGSLVRSRGLADRVHVPGWRITFCPPRGWQDQGYEDGEFGEATRYVKTGPAGPLRRLSFERLPSPPGTRAETVCLFVAKQLAGGLSPFELAAQELQSVRMGPLHGFRLITSRAYVQVGEPRPRAADGAYYVITLVASEPLTPGDLRLVEALAANVQLVDG